MRGGADLRFWVNAFTVCLLGVCVLGLVSCAFAATPQEATDQVASADHALRVAFKSVLDAEHSGANVSVLLTRLDEAGSALTIAEEALTAENYSVAVDSAAVCKSSADGVAGDAAALMNEAVAASGSWWLTVVLSVVASVVFVGVLFFVWRRLKQGYLRKMLRTRPEVTG